MVYVVDYEALIGKKYGNLTVIKVLKNKKLDNGERFRTECECICSCGNSKNIKLSELNKGSVISCGCYRNKLLVERTAQHHLSSHPLYQLWCGINKRCYHPQNTHYKYYGARGITNHWKDDVKGFISYVEENLGPKPTSKHSLDRVNNDGNYEPGNIRWASYKDQAANKTKPYEREIQKLKSRIAELEEEIRKFKNEHLFCSTKIT